MLYKNIGKGTKNFKLNGKWASALPGKVLNLPPHIGDNDDELELIKSVPVKKEEKLKPSKPEAPSDKELDDMTKDQLNDVAARLGYNALNTRWKLSKMLKALKKFLGR